MTSSSSAIAAVQDGKGVLLLIVSETLLAVVNAIVKFVQAWPAERIMAVRYAVDFVLCTALCGAMGIRAPPRAIAARLFLRGAAYCAFIGCLWAALRSPLPLGDVVVVVVAVSPIFLVLLARLLLGEQIPRLWPLQFMLCVAGAVMVNKPLAPERNCSAGVALLPVAAAFFGALMNLASRSVREVPAPAVCVFNDIVAVTFALGYMAVTSPSAPLLPDGLVDGNLGLVVLSAAVGWLGLMCNVKGYQAVSVAAVASIASYASVPLGYLLQVLVFGEALDPMSAAGASLIVCTNAAVTFSKYQAARGAAEALKDGKDYERLPDSEDPYKKAIGA